MTGVEAIIYYIAVTVWTTLTFIISNYLLRVAASYYTTHYRIFFCLYVPFFLFLMITVVFFIVICNTLAIETLISKVYCLNYFIKVNLWLKDCSLKKRI